MGRHSAIRRGPTGLAILGVVTLLVVGGGGAMVFAVWRSADDTVGKDQTAEPAVACSTPVRVVTAASFAPVLSALAPSLATGRDCARLEIRVADGRRAAQQIEHFDADVWIPDDPAWATVSLGDYAELNATVIATSTNSECASSIDAVS